MQIVTNCLLTYKYLEPFSGEIMWIFFQISLDSFYDIMEQKNLLGRDIHLKEIDQIAVQSRTDETTLNTLIAQSEFFIIKTASKITHRYISKSDDEWAIALQAFVQAVEGYQLGKGSFFSFADKVICRRLIDYQRKQNKYAHEIAVDPYIFDTPSETEEEEIAVTQAVSKTVSQRSDDSLKYEIEAANEVLAQFGFSFFDLVSCSPKAKKTKIACAEIIRYMVNHPELLDTLSRTRQLPQNRIEKNAQIPRKIIERYRKYIIAAVVILSGEYPYLADYIRAIGKELCK